MDKLGGGYAEIDDINSVLCVCHRLSLSTVWLAMLDIRDHSH